jgi:hypothetical protein
VRDAINGDDAQDSVDAYVEAREGGSQLHVFREEKLGANADALVLGLVRDVLAGLYVTTDEL